MPQTFTIPSKSGYTDGEYVYRREVAEKAVRWFPKYLRYPDGQWAGQAFHLREWQADIVRALYGWRRKKNEDIRRYHRLYMEVPRGNAKTAFGGALSIKGLQGDGKLTPLVIGAATDRNTAGIMFGYGSRMVLFEPKLAQRLRVIPSTKRIVRKNGTGIYQVISAEAPRAHGYHPSMILMDELHAQPDRELFDVLSTSQITVDDPVFAMFTTAGFDLESVCWAVHEESLSVANDPALDPELLAVVYAADPQDDWTSPEIWKKANPNLGVSVLEDALRKEVEKAMRMPAYQNAVLRLHFNIWTSAESRAIDMRKWDETAGLLDEDALAGKPCYLGIDLASTRDIACVAAVFPMSDGYRVLLWPFIPEANVHERAAQHHAPYEMWIDQGWLHTTPGNVIDFDFIEHKVVQDIRRKYQVMGAAFDRWGSPQLVTHLQDAGLEMVEWGQGFKSMAAPTAELLALIEQKRLIHGGNRVLRWMADNLMVTSDPAGNLKPDKKTSRNKIDGMVATIMALGLALKQDNVFRGEGIRFVG